MSTVRLTAQETLFLKRVALQLGDREPTEENMADAMREVCDRDQEIVNQVLEIDARTRPKRYHVGTRPGTGEESPLTTLARDIYRRIREA